LTVDRTALHGTGKFLLQTSPETYLPHEPRARFYDANTGKYSNNEGRKPIAAVTLLNSITGKIGYKGSGNTGYPGQRLYDDILSVMRKLFIQNVWSQIDGSKASIRDESGTWDDYLLKEGNAYENAYEKSKKTTQGSGATSGNGAEIENSKKGENSELGEEYIRIRIFRAKRGGNEGQYMPFWEGLWYNGPCEAYVYKFTTNAALEKSLKDAAADAAKDDGEEEDEEHDKFQPYPDLVNAVRAFEWNAKPDDCRCVFSVPALLRPYPLAKNELTTINAVDESIETYMGFRRLLKKKKDATDNNDGAEKKKDEAQQGVGEDPEAAKSVTIVEKDIVSWPHLLYTDAHSLKGDLQRRKVRSARTGTPGFALFRACRVLIFPNMRTPRSNIYIPLRDALQKRKVRANAPGSLVGPA
jgi:hypothetical protein